MSAALEERAGLGGVAWGLMEFALTWAVLGLGMVRISFANLTIFRASADGTFLLSDSVAHPSCVTGRSHLLYSRDDTGRTSLCVHPEIGTEWERDGFPGFSHWCVFSSTSGAHPVRGEPRREGRKRCTVSSEQTPPGISEPCLILSQTVTLPWVSCAPLGCHTPLGITCAVIRSTGFRTKAQIQMPLGSLAPKERSKARQDSEGAEVESHHSIPGNWPSADMGPELPDPCIIIFLNKNSRFWYEINPFWNVGN